MGRQSLRDRYLWDEWPRQLGSLASTLTRLGTPAVDPHYDQIAADLLREGALLIEWSAPHVSNSSPRRPGHHATRAVFVAEGLVGGGGPAIASLSSADYVRLCGNLRGWCQKVALFRLGVVNSRRLLAGSRWQAAGRSVGTPIDMPVTSW